MKKDLKMLATGVIIGAALFGGTSAAAAGIIAERSWQPIFVDGSQVSMMAYNIGGSNYVKLRDIGQAVGFNVYWEDGVQVDSKAAYTGVAPAGKEPVQNVDTEATRSEITALTNELRMENGISDLTANDLLMQAAQTRAEEMADASVYSHTRPDGSPYYSVTDCPYMAENINRIEQLYLEQQHKTLTNATMDSWKNSAGHRKNMLNGRLAEIGVGIARGVNDSGSPCWYCVQLFLYDGHEITRVDGKQT